MKAKPIKKTSLPVTIFDVNKNVSECLMQEQSSKIDSPILNSNTIYTINFDFPLESPVKIAFITDKFGWGKEQLIKEICSLLFKIYLDVDKYGAKKCSIEKLFLEQISVNEYTKEIKLAITSK